MTTTPPALGVKKLTGNSPVDPGKPIPVVIQLKGDQKRLCNSTALAIVFDVSGSLSVWHGEVKNSLVAVLPYVDLNVDVVAIAWFEDSFGSTGWTSDATAIGTALDSLESGGGTNLTAALTGTNTLMAGLGTEPDCIAALIVTDGRASRPAPSVLDVAKVNGWKYTFLGVGNQDVSNLNAMAVGTGGTYLDTSSAGTFQQGVQTAVDVFIRDALKIVAPANIVLTEQVNPALRVASVVPPSAPPNQQDPPGFVAAAGSAWSQLATSGKATLPAIDRLGIDPLGTRAEYSVDFEVAIDTCNEVSPTSHWVDKPGSQVTYTVPGFGQFTVPLPNAQVTVNACSFGVEKTWTAESRVVTVTLENNYAYNATDVELFEVLRDPLRITATSIPTVDGGAGQSHARFALGTLAPGGTTEVRCSIAPRTPLLGSQTFQVNDQKDSYVSFVVPWFAAEYTAGTPEHAALAAAIAAGVVGPAGKALLENCAAAVPHGHDTEVDDTATVTAYVGAEWPQFGWEVHGDRGTFLIKSEGSSYSVYLARTKWRIPLPELSVSCSELNAP